MLPKDDSVQFNQFNLNTFTFFVIATMLSGSGCGARPDSVILKSYLIGKK
jgi:hypothetical protein